MSSDRTASAPDPETRASGKKEDKLYTVLVLRHGQPRFRKLHLSRGFVLAASVLLAVLVLTGLYSPHLIFKVQTQSVQVDRLEQENLKLQEERDRFEAAMSGMARQLESFESQATRMARELGVEDLPSERPAAGGAVEGVQAPRRFWLEDEYEALQTRTDNLDQSMEKLEEVFQQRIHLLASTPNMMPVEGWFSHGYGWRKDPFSGERAFHRGVDIVAHAGTQILAPADGVVARAGRVGQYGKTVDLSHGLGYVTRYAHMSELLVRVGSRVQRGDVIGRVGSTGRSTGPHLHYEVFKDGRRVNPWKYLGQSRH